MTEAAPQRVPLVHGAVLFLGCLAGAQASAPWLRGWLGVAGLGVAELVFFLLLPRLLARRWVGCPPRVTDPWSFSPRLLPAVLLFVPAAVLFLGLYEHFQERHLFPYREELVEAYRRAFAGPGVSRPWLFLSVALVPALCEEYFFRGLLQGALESRVSRAAALVMTAALFAVTHLPVAVWPPLLLLGLGLGALRSATGSILPGALLHLVNNLLALALLVGPAEPFERLFRYSHAAFAGSACLAAGALLLLHLSARRLRRRAGGPGSAAAGP